MQNLSDDSESSSEEKLQFDEFDDLSPVPEHLKNKISAASIKDLEAVLLPDETVLHLETPLFWRSLNISLNVFFANAVVLAISGAGTLSMLIIAIFFTSTFTYNGYLTMAVFPVVLLASLYGFWSRKSCYIAFTNQRLIINDGDKKMIEYKEIINVTLEMNYLHFRTEMKIEKEGKPKLVYAEAIPSIERYCDFLNQKKKNKNEEKKNEKSDSEKGKN